MGPSIKNKGNSLSASPGLFVMGGDSCSEGYWFESQHCIMDGHLSQILVVQIAKFV